jgi:isopentenyl diphosphate isomerase/L-lactate dehydrogenase-like FMN-dependent dehydrogenase
MSLMAGTVVLGATPLADPGPGGDRLGAPAGPAVPCRRMANEWFESVAVAQRRAKRRLPASVYGALIAGADKGISMGDNTAAFDELGFRPVTAGQSPSRDMSVEVMGQPCSMPVLVSPTGVQAVHPDGEVAVARAAAARGVPMGLSSFASKPIEDVVAANPQTLFQIYWAGDRDSIVARMERARTAGAVGIIVTLDWSFVHSRDWGSPSVPSAIDLETVKRHAFEVAIKPRWLLQWLRTGALPGFGVPNFAVGDQPVPGFFEAYGTWMERRRPRGTTSPGCEPSGTARSW